LRKSPERDSERLSKKKPFFWVFQAMNFMLKAKIVPNAKAFEVCGWTERKELRIRVSEKPIHGKANQSIEQELAGRLKAPVRIVKGFQSSQKIIEIGLDEKEAVERINALFLQKALSSK
jgi:uncharacterized protein (TIGR00251 family)